MAPGRNYKAVIAAVIVASAGCSSSSNGGTPAQELTLVTPAEGTPIDHAAKGSLWFCPKAGVPAPPLVLGQRDWVEGTTVHSSKIPYVTGSVTWTSDMTVTLTDTTRII